ncbi:MAG: hypothetical protein HY873_14650 [Chloroflexi bacterium]|nr:hypothetical protein [Chloroflexota bacterium]
MTDNLHQRIGRIYAAFDAAEEQDMANLRAQALKSDRFVGGFQDFSGGLTPAEIENVAYSLIHNVTNVGNHARGWAKTNGKNPGLVDDAVKASFEIRVIMDLSNRDKHGPPRDRGHSRRSPTLVDVRRVLELRTGSEKGSSVGMTLNADGTPRIVGSGSAKAVLTGRVLDDEGSFIGDFDSLVRAAVGHWEQLLRQLGALPTLA